MTVTYMQKTLEIRRSNNDDRHILFAYVRRVYDGDELIAESSPHRGSFADDALDREYVIATDGETRTGQQMLDEAGVSLK